MIVSIISYVVLIIANWKVFEKMGRNGWECIIPLYNMYVMFDVLYGNGWKFLLLCIPLVNIYIAIKFYIDLAKAFGQSGAFAAGLILVNPIFVGILGYGSAQYQGL